MDELTLRVSLRIPVVVANLVLENKKEAAEFPPLLPVRLANATA